MNDAPSPQQVLQVLYQMNPYVTARNTLHGAAGMTGTITVRDARDAGAPLGIGCTIP